VRIAISLAAAAIVTMTLTGCGTHPSTSQVPESQVSSGGDPLAAAAEAYLPRAAVPAGLSDPAVGSRDFAGTGVRVVDSRGDWYFVAIGDKCAVPVPGGWQISDADEGTYLRFSAVGNIDRPDVRIRIGSVGVDGDIDNTTDALEYFKVAVSAELPTAKVVNERLADDNHGYVLFSIPGRPGEPSYMLQIIAWDQHRQEFQTFNLIVGAKARDLYPVVMAMVAGWVDAYGQPLGTPLPDDLL
jgi:hypothetical protein